MAFLPVAFATSLRIARAFSPGVSADSAPGLYQKLLLPKAPKLKRKPSSSSMGKEQNEMLACALAQPEFANSTAARKLQTRTSGSKRSAGWPRKGCNSYALEAGIPPGIGNFQFEPETANGWLDIANNDASQQDGTETNKNA